MHSDTRRRPFTPRIVSRVCATAAFLLAIAVGAAAQAPPQPTSQPTPPSPPTQPSTPTSPSPALARPPIWPQFDLSGGLTFIRMAPGPDLDRANLPGWTASFTFYPLPRLGFAAEVSGARRTQSLSDTLAPDADVRLQQTSFLAGPTYRLFNRGPVSSRVRAMFGVAHLSSEFPEDALANGIAPGQTPREIGLFEDETVFAAAFGTAWDIRLARAVALRVNPTFMLTRFNGETQFTQRFSTGLVFWLAPRGPRGMERAR